MGVPRQGPGLIPGGKRLQSETQKRSQANAPHTVAQPLPTTPLPRRGWEPATHPLLEGPALGGKGFHGRILTCPHPLGPRTSSQSFLGSGLGWRQSRWLSGPRRAVRGALGHTPLSAKASPAFTAKHASAWIRRNRELNRGFGGGTGGGGMSRRHLAKSNGSQAPGMGCGFRATQTQLLWPCPGALSRGVGPKGSGGPDPARVPSISSCRLCPPWRLHASEFLCLALRPGGLDPGTRDGFPPQPLPRAAQPLPPSCIQPPAPFQTCSCASEQFLPWPQAALSAGRWPLPGRPSVEPPEPPPSLCALQPRPRPPSPHQPRVGPHACWRPPPLCRSQQAEYLMSGEHFHLLT